MNGKVAQQQALRHLGATYQQIAEVFQIHKRTAYSHCAAKPGSNVTPWEARSYAERNRAIQAAEAAWHEAFQYGRVTGKAYL